MAPPRMYDDSSPTINRLRQLCLSLPEAFEKEAWGECTFRVTGGSMFAMTDNDHHGSGHIAVWVKAPPMVQEILAHADADRFFVPPYLGPKGWLGVRLDDKVDWEELGGILKDGYLMSAPKRLRERLAPATSEGTAASPNRKPRRSQSTSRAMPASNTEWVSRTKPRSKKIRGARHQKSR